MENDFIEFLKKNGIYELYIQNIFNDHHVTFDDIIKRHNPKNWIKAAFTWELTKQGLKYWSKIDKEWIKEISK